MVRSRKRAKYGLPDRAKKAPRLDTSTWLDRIDAARLLHVTTNTIINWQNEGRLTPLKVTRPDNGGSARAQWVYDPKELVTMRHGRLAPTRSPGELAARCFELFDAAKSVGEIVVALRETPETVRQLHEEWLDAGGSDFVINQNARGVLESLVGPFAGVADLIHLVTNLVHAAQGHVDKK